MLGIVHAYVKGMTKATALTLCKALGMSARYISDTREFRIVPNTTPLAHREDRAYYTDCPFDAVYTAVSLMNHERGR